MVMDQTGAPVSFVPLPNAGSIAGLSDYYIEDGDVIFLSWDGSTAPLTPVLVRIGAEPWSRPLELETTEIEPALGGGIVASSLYSVSRLAEAAEPIWSRSYEDIHGRRTTSRAAIVMSDVGRIVMASPAVSDVEPLNTDDGAMPDAVDIVSSRRSPTPRARPKACASFASRGTSQSPRCDERPTAATSSSAPRRGQARSRSEA
jgi:hypothetical protein